MLRVPNEPLPGQQITAADHAALIRYVKQSTPRKSIGQLRRMGSGGFTTRQIQSNYYPPPPSAVPWPFKCYKKIVGTNAYLQINGGDGADAMLAPTDGSASGEACVNGNATDTKLGMPLAFPLLVVTGNGEVYVKTWLNASGQVTAGASAGATGVDVLFIAGVTPASDTASPPTFGSRKIGSISNWALSDAGVPSFDYNDSVGPVGVNTVAVCGSTVTIS